MRISGPNRCGFTLTEIAIVIGVAGAIIAAVFAAASITQYRVSLNQASDELNQTAGNLRSLYAGRVIDYAAINAAHTLNATPSAADYTYYMPIFIAAGVFPSEMKSAANIINNPWNGASVTHTAQVSLAGSAGNLVQLVVEYKNLTSEQCTDLVVRNSLPGVDAVGHSLPESSGLQQIKVNTTAIGIAGNTLTPLPVPPVNAAAANACGGTSPFTVDWYYSLGS